MFKQPQVVRNVSISLLLKRVPLHMRAAQCRERAGLGDGLGDLELANLSSMVKPGSDVNSPR